MHEKAVHQVRNCRAATCYPLAHATYTHAHTHTHRESDICGMLESGMFRSGTLGNGTLQSDTFAIESGEAIHSGVVCWGVVCWGVVHSVGRGVIRSEVVHLGVRQGGN